MGARTSEARRHSVTYQKAPTDRSPPLCAFGAPAVGAVNWHGWGGGGRSVGLLSTLDHNEMVWGGYKTNTHLKQHGLGVIVRGTSEAKSVAECRSRDHGSGDPAHQRDAMVSADVKCCSHEKVGVL